MSISEQVQALARAVRDADRRVSEALVSGQFVSDLIAAREQYEDRFHRFCDQHDIQCCVVF